jgi:hypothetical protein
MGTITRAVVKLVPSTLMMEADTVYETSDYNSILTWLIAREDFSGSCTKYYSTEIKSKNGNG